MGQIWKKFDEVVLRKIFIPQLIQIFGKFWRLRGFWKKFEQASEFLIGLEEFPSKFFVNFR